MKIIGEMDVYTSPSLKSAISQQITHEKNRILLDLSELEYLDSTGLGTISGCLIKLKRCGGDLRFLRPTSICLKLLKITDLIDSFIVYQSLQEARKGWQGYKSRWLKV